MPEIYFSMSNGVLEGLAACQLSSGIHWVCKRIASLSFRVILDFTPPKISVNFSSEMKDGAKRDYIEGRLSYTLTLPNIPSPALFPLNIHWVNRRSISNIGPIPI